MLDRESEQSIEREVEIHFHTLTPHTHTTLKRKKFYTHCHYPHKENYISIVGDSFLENYFRNREKNKVTARPLQREKI